MPKISYYSGDLPSLIAKRVLVDIDGAVTLLAGAQVILDGEYQLERNVRYGLGEPLPRMVLDGMELIESSSTYTSTSTARRTLVIDAAGIGLLAVYYVGQSGPHWLVATRSPLPVAIAALFRSKRLGDS